MPKNEAPETPMTETQDLIELLIKVTSELEKSTPDITYLKALLAVATPDNTRPISRYTPLLRKFREADDRRSRLRAAALLYIGAGKEPAEIARMLKVPLETFTQWTNSPEWKEALSFWGFSGEEAYPLRNRKQSSDTPLLHKLRLMDQLENEFGYTQKTENPSPLRHYDQDERTPYTLTEKYLLETAFGKEGDVRFVTYARKFTDGTVQSVNTYDIALTDGRVLKKINILLVFAKAKMPSVKTEIKRRESLANQQLSPIVKPRSRPKISIEARKGDTVQCVMRNGLVVTGKLMWVSKYNILLRVGRNQNQGKVVLVYRHGLYEFNVIVRETKSQPKREHTPRHDFLELENE